MSLKVSPFNRFGAAYLLVVCDNELAVLAPSHAVGFTVVLHANSSVAIMLVHFQDAPIWNVGDKKVAMFIACWAFKKDILEVSSEASSPIAFVLAAQGVWYARQKLRFDDWRDRIEIHVCLQRTSC